MSDGNRLGYGLFQCKQRNGSDRAYSADYANCKT